MATTRDYTDYINDQVDIAPTNSQEELQAAELIEGLFVQHGLETQIQEFDAHTFSGVSSRVYLILLFIGVLLSGFLGTPASRVGLVLVALSFVLIALAKSGHDPIGSIGPMARSQNVIGVHRATGPNVVKGNRPIVIIAHYDTPRENFLNKPQFASWQPLIKRLSWPLSIAVLVLAVTQAIPAIPAMVLHVLWAMGVIVALPLLMLGAASVYERFANCTTGANDNKASVAAMLGVLDMVRPTSDDAKEWAATHPKGVRHKIAEESDADDLYDDDDVDFEELDQEIRNEASGNQEDRDADVTYEVDEAGDRGQEESVPSAVASAASYIDEYGLRSPSTKRRGAQLLESLEVLPATCEIVYENLIPRDEAMEILDLRRASESDGDALGRARGAASGIGESLGNGLRSAREGVRGFFGSVRDSFKGLVGRIKKEQELPEIEKGDVEVTPVVTYGSGQGSENVGQTQGDAYEYDDEYDDPYDDPYENEAPDATRLNDVTYEDSSARVEVHDRKTQEFQVPQVSQAMDATMPTLVDMRVPEVTSEVVPEPSHVDSVMGAGHGDARFRQPLTFEVEQETVVPAEALSQDEPVSNGSPIEQPVAQQVATYDALGVTGTMSPVDGLAADTTTSVEKDESNVPGHHDEEASVPATVDDEKPVDEPDEDADLWTPAEIVDVDEGSHQGSAEELPADHSSEQKDDVHHESNRDEDTKDSSQEANDSASEETSREAEVMETDDSWKDKVAIHAALNLDEYPEISSGISGTEVLSALAIENAAVVEALGSYAEDEYASFDAQKYVPTPEDLIDIEQIAFEDNPWKHVSLAYPDADYVVIDETIPFEQVPVEVVEATSPMFVADHPSQPIPSEPLYEESYEELYEGEDVNGEADRMRDDGSAQGVEDVVDVEPEHKEDDALVDEPAQDAQEVAIVEPEQNEEIPQTEEPDKDESDHIEPMDSVESIEANQVLTEEAGETEDVAVDDLDAEDTSPSDEISKDTNDADDAAAEKASAEEAAEQASVFDASNRPVFTPSYIDEIDDPDESELETTLTFKTLSQEDIDAHRAKLEQADSEASSVLHQMFASVPKQEPYEQPRTTNVLHEMFSALPSIEPMTVQGKDHQPVDQEQERSFEATASEDAKGGEAAEPVQESEQLEGQHEGTELYRNEADDAIAMEGQPTTDEQGAEEEQPAQEPQQEEPHQEEELTEPEEQIAAPTGVKQEPASSSGRLSILEEIPLAQWETVEDVQEPDESQPHAQSTDEQAAPVEEGVEIQAPVVPHESYEAEAVDDTSQQSADEVEQDSDVERSEAEPPVKEGPKFWFEKRPTLQAESAAGNPRQQSEPALETVEAETEEATDEGMTSGEESPSDAEALQEGEGQAQDVVTEESEATPQANAHESSKDDAQKLMSGLTFSVEPEVSEEELEEKDLTGLTTMSIEAEADVEDSIPQVEERIPKPRAIDDPNWGKSSFKPTLASAGRRATLLDLPDPSVMAVSSTASGSADTGDSEVPDAVPELVSRRLDVLHRVPSPLDEPIRRMPHESGQSGQESVQKTPSQDKGTTPERKSLRERLSFTFKREDEAQQQESMSDWLGLDSDYDAKKDGRQIGSWDNFEDKDTGKWKGGATLRSGLRGDDIDDEMAEEEQVRRPFVGLPNFDSLDLMPNDDDEIVMEEVQNEVLEDVAEELLDAEIEQELREAVLHLGDDDLIAHDIWFVGVGASSLNHAGIKAFLDEHRRDIRGAFLVNLDSIGAGDLTLLTHEGMGEKRRGDRRMARMLSNIAEALHIKLGRADYSWEETDATPAMQRSVRVATLMGMSEEGVPAHSHTADDEPEYLDDRQIADVADIVAQLIREA